MAAKNRNAPKLSGFGRLPGSPGRLDNPDRSRDDSLVAVRALGKKEQRQAKECRKEGNQEGEFVVFSSFS
jgi:hypothetical protein